MQVGNKVRLVKALSESGDPDYVPANTEGLIVSISKYGPFQIGVEFGDLHWFCNRDELEVVDSPAQA